MRSLKVGRREVGSGMYFTNLMSTLIFLAKVDGFLETGQIPLGARSLIG
ncbi:hypothetical protein AAGF08_11075 [Algoriphagus sp. SE2]